jgi:predicted nicotinamide N-methyase
MRDTWNLNFALNLIGRCPIFSSCLNLITTKKCFSTTKVSNFQPYRWEDGSIVHKSITEPDRWEVHSAETVTITLGPPDNPISLVIKQRPQQINWSNGTGIGVGACLWDGALALSSYLIAFERQALNNAVCIELGAGVGACGCAAAKLGARHTILTDLVQVLPLMQENIEANGLTSSSENNNGSTSKKNKKKNNNINTLKKVEAHVLKWGEEGWLDHASSLKQHAGGHFDFIIAADCCYIDGDGETPSTVAFTQTLAALSTPGGSSRCLVASEQRAEEVRQQFITTARKLFKEVKRIDLNTLPPPMNVEYIDLWELRL